MTLGLAGAAALHFTLPIAVSVAFLLTVVVISYRQTVRAYPSGGGAYVVAHENLGKYPGLLAGAALLVDYVLTVSVSVTAGVDAIVSAAGGLTPRKIELAIGFVAFVTLVNLRGVREAGTLFAIPTYGFVLSIYLLVGTGIARCAGGCPVAETAAEQLHSEVALGGFATLFLVSRAFAAGTTALTGVEAISTGVPAFRYPQSRNAAATLGMMGAIAITMFLGITWLARATGVRFTEEMGRTVLAQIAHSIFGSGALFYLVQVMTAAILILAANTAYQGFPRLSSVLARDRFMPRQFMNRGDRLVFSNGVVVLGILASALIVIFDANLNRLIQLYLVGVFISFTLSQWGMVAHWRRFQEGNWKRSLTINAVGGTVTGIVLIIVVSTKFTQGAWIVVCAIPILIGAMRAVNNHYEDVAHVLAQPERRPVDRRAGQQRVVILAENVDAAVARALGYARAIRPREITAIGFDAASAGAWSRLAPDVRHEILARDGSRIAGIRRYLRTQRRNMPDEDFLTLVVPEILRSKSFFEILRHPRLHRLKAAFLFEPGVQVMDMPILRTEITRSVDDIREPAHNRVVVLVSGVHNATLQAIEYAETLRPTDLRAVTIALDPERSEDIGNKWLENNIPHPLEIEDSPFRDIGTSLRHYVRKFHPDGVHRVVTVVIPEFIVSKRRHQILHGQTALLVKRHLLFEPGVVVASVPYHLKDQQKTSGTAAVTAGT